MHIYMYTYSYTYIHAYIHAYIGTHTHTELETYLEKERAEFVDELCSLHELCSLFLEVPNWRETSLSRTHTFPHMYERVCVNSGFSHTA